MDESSLSSRSAAIDALSTLSASHARLLGLATSLVDRLFPGDGTIRDEAILPFANLAFIAVGKARIDLDTYSKSFEGVLKTIDSIRPPPVPVQFVVPVASDANGQSESGASTVIDLACFIGAGLQHVTCPCPCSGVL